MRQKLAAGNWKMNGLSASLSEIYALKQSLRGIGVDVMLCPPAPYLSQAVAAADGTLQIGAQNCHAETSGAFTGEISAEMIKDIGASAVILGHSERRELFEEASEDVREKARAAIGAGLTAIVCMGETLAQREGKNTLDIIGGQLSASIPDGCTAENLVVAYEPIWAIGTGLVANTDQIGEVHDFIRARLERRFGAEVGGAVRVLYGGSVKAENAAEIFATSNVDGALVGGASLKAADFTPIVQALNAAS